MTNDKLPKPLAALLKAVKAKETPEFTWVFAKETLGIWYSSDMSFSDILIVLFGFYSQMIEDRRFEIPTKNMFTTIYAPLHVFTGIGARNQAKQNNGHGFKPTKLSDEATVEEFYNCMISQVLSDMRLSRIDWCHEEIFGVRND